MEEEPPQRDKDGPFGESGSRAAKAGHVIGPTPVASRQGRRSSTNSRV